MLQSGEMQCPRDARLPVMCLAHKLRIDREIRHGRYADTCTDLMLLRHRGHEHPLLRVMCHSYIYDATGNLAFTCSNSIPGQSTLPKPGAILFSCPLQRSLCAPWDPAILEHNIS